MTALLVAVAALVALQLRGEIATRRPATARPWPVLPSPVATVDIGVTTLPLARDSWRRWQPSDLVTVNAWEQAIRKHASVVMWYADWTTPPPSSLQLDAVAERGSVPEITWEPWRSHPAAKAQPLYALRNIADGRFDAYIRSWAERLASYGRPVRLRFAQEMNGNWYPWSEHANGNRPGEFVRAWRHVHDVFRSAGATNAEWVWSPAAIRIRSSEYPGDGYVSIVAVTVFNGGSQLRYARWRSAPSLLGRSLARLHAIAPRKPVELSEVGCAEQGGSKAAWIAGLFRTLRRHPEITSVIWYDLAKGSDWRLASSREAAAAFAAGVAASRYR
jgi:beta-mannanase